MTQVPLGQAADIGAGELHSARARINETHQQPAERRLTAAAFTDQTNDLAGRDRQRDRIDRRYLPRLVAQPRATSGQIQPQRGKAADGAKALAERDRADQWIAGKAD